MGFEHKDRRTVEGRPGRWHTGIFTKRPLPGAVKTRLVPPLDPEGAARLQEAMLRDVVERFVAAPLAPVLWYAPAEDRAWFEEAFPSVRLEPQCGPDLARRMAYTFEDVLFDADSAVLVGSDQPLIPAERIVEAHRALEEGAEVVLGPDLGGGYYLIGMRGSHPELFLGIEMSTESMCTATIERAREFGLALHLLPEELDVDTGADLERLRDTLFGDGLDPASPDYPARTAGVLAELFRDVPLPPTQ